MNIRPLFFKFRRWPRSILLQIVLATDWTSLIWRIEVKELARTWLCSYTWSLVRVPTKPRFLHSRLPVGETTGCISHKNTCILLFSVKGRRTAKGTRRQGFGWLTNGFLNFYPISRLMGGLEALPGCRECTGYVVDLGDGGGLKMMFSHT